MSAELLDLIYRIFIMFVLISQNAVCLDENFDYWYSSDDGLVPGQTLSAHRSQNFTSKRLLRDGGELVELRGKDHDQQCIRIFCLIECLNNDKRTLGICQNNRCVCTPGHQKLRTYAEDYYNKY